MFVCGGVQNIHLVAKWLPKLEKKIEEYSDDSHESYRLFVSAEPAGSPDAHIIPQGILESAIKITNEPPTGMFANLHKALDNFNQVGAIIYSVKGDIPKECVRQPPQSPGQHQPGGCHNL